MLCLLICVLLVNDALATPGGSFIQIVRAANGTEKRDDSSNTSEGVSSNTSSNTSQPSYEEPMLAIEDVYPGNQEKQQLYCFIKHEFAALSEIQNERTRQELQNKSCALVSTSGALRAHEQGDAIEREHDVILRFHSSPTRGYEKFVGNRTDYSLVGSPTGISFNTIGGEQLPVVGEVREAHKELGDCLQDVVKANFASLYPGRMGMHEVPELGKNDPTTGAKGILVAIANCKTVDAYEMTPSKQAPNFPYHYYDNPFKEPEVKADDNPWHGMIKAEHDLWQRLSSGTAQDMEELGKTSYPGFSTVRCPDAVEHPAVLGFFQDS